MVAYSMHLLVPFTQLSDRLGSHPPVAGLPIIRLNVPDYWTKYRVFRLLYRLPCIQQRRIYVGAIYPMFYFPLTLLSAQNGAFHILH